MLTMTQIAGFAGTGLAGAAYVPQISHLVRARCSAGISRLAFAIRLLASVLTTARALAIGAGVFIVLGGIQIVATTLILPRPGGQREASSTHPAASLAEITRIYGIRNWIEQSYKQVKDELGWADFQVRSDVAIRRHQALVNCAFSFCWDAWFGHPAPPALTPPAPQPGSGERGSRARRAGPAVPGLAPGASRRARLAYPVDRAAALVGRMVQRAPAAAAASPDRLGRGRLRPAPLHPQLTNYR